MKHPGILMPFVLYYGQCMSCVDYCPWGEKSEFWMASGPEKFRKGAVALLLQQYLREQQLPGHISFLKKKKKKKHSTSEASGNRMASDWCSCLPQICSVWVRDAWRLSGPQQLTSGITWEEDAGSHLSVQVQKRLSKKSGPEGWLSIIGYTLLPALRKETDSSLEVNQ